MSAGVRSSTSSHSHELGESVSNPARAANLRPADWPTMGQTPSRPSVLDDANLPQWNGPPSSMRL